MSVVLHSEGPSREAPDVWPVGAGGRRWALGATARRLFIRVARLTAFLAVILVVIPLLLGASDDFLGNAAAIGAGGLLSNGYACALLHLSARKWEQSHDRALLYEVRPHWSIRPTVVYTTAK